LPPDATDAADATAACAEPARTPALGRTETDDTCTVPIESDAVLLPEPSWTVAIELMAVFPGSASAGAAVPRIAAAEQAAATRPTALHLMVLSLSRVGLPPTEVDEMPTTSAYRRLVRPLEIEGESATTPVRDRRHDSPTSARSQRGEERRG
jgi:hypothetical protein